MTTREQIYDAVGTVYDTCNVFNGTNLDIVEMGLVHDVEQEGSSDRVRLLLSDPMCVYLFEMRSQIVNALTALPGVDHVGLVEPPGPLHVEVRHSLLLPCLAPWCCRKGSRRGTTSFLQSCLRRC